MDRHATMFVGLLILLAFIATGAFAGVVLGVVVWLPTGYAAAPFLIFGGVAGAVIGIRQFYILTN